MRFRNNTAEQKTDSDIPLLGYELCGQNIKRSPELLAMQIMSLPRVIHAFDPAQEAILAEVREWDAEVKAKAAAEERQRIAALGGVAVGV